MTEMICKQLELINWNDFEIAGVQILEIVASSLKLIEVRINIQGHQPQQFHHLLLEARLAVTLWHGSSVLGSHPNAH